MNIIITGNAGFIGSHLVESLIKSNQVFGIDNFNSYYDPKLKEENIKTVKDDMNFTQYRCDIRDMDQLRKVFTDNTIDLVIHLAAMAGVRPSIEDPQLYTEVNINGTVNLLELCREFGVKKFIFASSSSVYGNSINVPFSEDDNVDYPISPYAATKKAGELICHTYHKLFDMSVLCLRFFTVYGPRQRPDLAIRKFTKMIRRGEKIPVFGDGSTKRDYTYIDDIIDGLGKAVNYITDNHVFDIFNLGESRTISLDEMIQTIENVLSIKAIKDILPMQSGDVQQTYANISKSKRILGYNPSTDFETGLSLIHI